MKEYSTEFIRNIALASHSSSGKTMLAEALLHFTGGSTRLGKVEDGSTISDFEDEEHRRGISLSTSVIPVEYRDHKINLLDTPGYSDFIGEVISALRVADGAVLLVDSVAGVEVGTEAAWNYAAQGTLYIPLYAGRVGFNAYGNFRTFRTADPGGFGTIPASREDPKITDYSLRADGVIGRHWGFFMGYTHTFAVLTKSDLFDVGLDYRW